MIGGLETTFEILTQTKNEAAVSALIPALDCAHQAVQEEALRALLCRRSPTGQRELLTRWSTISSRWKSIIAEHPGRMTSAVRAAVLGSDAQMCANGCDALLTLREFDLMPALVNAAEDASNPNADLTGWTLLNLVQLLYDELATPRDYRIRRDPQLVRKHIVSCLENSIGRFGNHKRVEIIEAFLLLTKRDNSALKKIFQDPYGVVYLAIVETLSNSQRPGVMRLTLSYLDDPRAPGAALHTLAHRSDAKFLAYLMKKIGFEPSASAMQNLQRVDSIAWVRGDLRVLDGLDDAGQHAAVQLVMASGMKRLEVFHVITYLLGNGKPAGRRAACAALAEFKGAEANQLAVQAMEDSDPEVQANALAQIRTRGIPGALSKLISMIDSPHGPVRSAARRSLGEFSFERFLGAFDMLDEKVRQSTGQLVKKVDPHVKPALILELQAKARSRRLRALAVSAVLGMAAELEEQIIELMGDEDHMVRIEASRALAWCDTSTAREALREALQGRSVPVQQAAQESLQDLASGSATQDVVAQDLLELSANLMQTPHGEHA